jgi:PcrA/UvrD tudor domain
MPDMAPTSVPNAVTKPSKAKAANQGLNRTTARVKPKPHPAAVTAPIPYVSPFAIGDHISHPQFGEGTVTEIDDAKLTIDFASRGTKQIIDYYVKRSKEG